ncbi:hypothetical protein EV426DRAFT_701732 [Tirmania nivea]|nr:hypothetical protein EV426DRAFT_701732 [Tirmania nivea]
MSDLGAPNKRPRNQYSLTDKATLAGVCPDNDGNDSCHRSRTYGTKAKPSSTLPAFKPLTITKHVDRSTPIAECHSSGKAAHLNSDVPHLHGEGVDIREGLDRFRFHGGNGMARSIRTQKSGGSGGNREVSARYQPQSLLSTTTEEDEEYGWDIGYDEALMVDYIGAEVKNDPREIQAEYTGEMKNAVSKCEQFNIASQRLDDGFFERGDTQSKILVEEEGLHNWDGVGGDYIVLTPSQSNTILPVEDYGEDLPVLGKTPEPCCDDYFTTPEIPSELQQHDYTTRLVELEDASFIPVNNNRQSHLRTVRERFTAPSDVAVGYGDESPEVFDPNLPCSTLSDGSEKLPGHATGLSDVEYDAFDDDDLWKEIAKKDFYIPPNSDPPSGIEDLVEKESPIQPTYTEEVENYVNPPEIDLEPQRGKAVETVSAEASVPALSRKRGRGKVRVPLPPTLISPISHMSNPNPPQPQVSLSAKRMMVFQGNSPRLARMTERLELLQSLDEGISELPGSAIQVAESDSKATKWAHLPPEERQKPFVRPPLPEPVKERSPIEGLNTKTMMRVCFRVGEAIRFSNMDRLSGGWGESEILTELFARVTFSERIGMKQNIQFGDIYHDHPPFLSGSYNLFRACSLWDEDSADLLGEQGKGKMVRVVGKVKKVGVGMQEGMHGYWMEVLSVWECVWEDVERARGVVCGW